MCIRDRVQTVHRGVKRRSLPRPRRPRNQNDPIWTADELVEDLVVLLRESKLPNADLDVVFVEQAEDARLTVIGRDDRNSEIELFLA